MEVADGTGLVNDHKGIIIRLTSGDLPHLLRLPRTVHWMATWEKQAINKGLLLKMSVLLRLIANFLCLCKTEFQS